MLVYGISWRSNLLLPQLTSQISSSLQLTSQISSSLQLTFQISSSPTSPLSPVTKDPRNYLRIRITFLFKISNLTPSSFSFLPLHIFSSFSLNISLPSSSSFPLLLLQSPPFLPLNLLPSLVLTS